MSNLKPLRLWPIGLVLVASVVIVAAQQPVTVVSGTISSNKTNNAAVPGATNLGVLPCVANAAAPSWTEGDQVTCSVDLSGNQRFTISNPGATRTVNGTAAVALVAEQYNVLQSGGTAAMTGTTSTQVIAAVASNYIYVSSCSVNNTHASVDTLVDLQDGVRRLGNLDVCHSAHAYWGVCAHLPDSAAGANPRQRALWERRNDGCECETVLPRLLVHGRVLRCERSCSGCSRRSH